jgi:isoamylase
MLLGGDEMGRTQLGNNNAYCQDNDLNWFDWPGADQALLAFTRELVAFRKAHPVFRRQRFLAGADAADLGWYTPAGTAMTTANWVDSNARAVAIYLDGSDAPDRTADGSPLIDDDFLVLVSAWWEPLAFTIPAVRAGQPGETEQTWHAEIDSYDPARPAAALRAGDQLTVQPRSIVVLRSARPPARAS